MRLFPIAALLLVSLLAVSGLLGSCAGAGVVSIESIQKKLDLFSSEIQKDRNTILTIKKRRVSQTGFYYIINSEGKVVFHPRPLLVGADFSRFYFVAEMLKKREGCYSVNRGSSDQLMIFKPISSDEILCLSIPAHEVASQNLACERLTKKNK